MWPDSAGTQPVWSLFLVVLAFFIILHLRNRKRRRPPPKVYARRISGAQIVAYIQPAISRACLTDHGIQYGKGFRRKEGPQLPHDSSCRCRSVPFSYTSNEVFNGALRRDVEVESTIPGLPADQARRLIERLREAAAQPLPADEETYIAEVDLAHFGARHREEIAAFLRERYAFLAAGGDSAPAEAAAAPATGGGPEPPVDGGGGERKEEAT